MRLQSIMPDYQRLVPLNLTTISQFTSIDVVKSAYAFPCKGGIGEEYCSGYHAGAIQADKDDNANRT